MKNLKKLITLIILVSSIVTFYSCTEVKLINTRIVSKDTIYTIVATGLQKNYHSSTIYRSSVSIITKSNGRLSEKWINSEDDGLRIDTVYYPGNKIKIRRITRIDSFDAIRDQRSGSKTKETIQYVVINK